MSPLAALILVALLLVVWFGTRAQALAAMVCSVLYLSQLQQVSFLGINLFAVRFMELAGFLRVMSRGEFSFSRLNSLDRVFLGLYAYLTIVFLLRSWSGFGNAIGEAVDATFCYFIFRGLIRGMDDIRAFLRVFVLILAPYMVVLFMERRIGYVPFSFMAGLGGFERHGVVRCMGSFRSMDLLGSLGATFLPLYIAMLLSKTDRWRTIVGICFCVLIVWLSNSGGPVSVLGVALVGWGMWRVRTKMRLFRIGLATGLFLLALVMKAPIWYLLDRVSRITGGTGWHRAYLIDTAFKHLDQWWFAGMSIKATRSWFPYVIEVTGGADITNQYLVFGIKAGLGAVVLLILLLVCTFRLLGKAMSAARAGGAPYRSAEMLQWGVGVMMVVHLFNWFGISYYDQFYVIWCMQLAMVSAVTVGVVQSTRAVNGENIQRPLRETTRDAGIPAAGNAPFAGRVNFA